MIKSIIILCCGMYRHTTDKTITIEARRASFVMQLSLLIFCSGATWVFASIFCTSISNNINNAFERSGSVLVLVSVFLEYAYRSSAIRRVTLSVSSIRPRDENYSEVTHYLINFASWVRSFAVLAGISGTLIWGYGSAI